MAMVVVRFLDDDDFIEFQRRKFTEGFDPLEFARHEEFARYGRDRVAFTVGVDGIEAAEVAFDLSNNPSRQTERDTVWGRRRSLSVGDLVEVWEGTQVTTYLCDSIGWLEV